MNTQLGFRNFNAFLHHYRICAAQRALADPEKREQSVAEIMFEVGLRHSAQRKLFDPLIRV